MKLASVAKTVFLSSILAISTVASAADLKIKVLGDYVEDGVLKSYPLTQLGIYEGFWQNGDRIAFTDENGQAAVKTSDDSLKLSFFKMTSSHTAINYYYGQVNLYEDSAYLEVHLAPEQANILVDYQTEYGEALYLTGQSHYLGDWKTAIRLNYDPYFKRWSYFGHLPLGAEFKILSGPWTDETVVDIDSYDLQWQQGANEKIVKTVGYYEAQVRVSPQF